MVQSTSYAAYHIFVFFTLLLSPHILSNVPCKAVSVLYIRADNKRI